VDESLSNEIGHFRNNFTRPEALVHGGGSAWQQAKGTVNCAHMSNPGEQRSEVFLCSPGEIGIHHLFDPKLADGGLSAHLRFWKEP
jgi:hypothetical protein